jgi:hypothetical protein
MYLGLISSITIGHWLIEAVLLLGIGLSVLTDLGTKLS